MATTSSLRWEAYLLARFLDHLNCNDQSRYRVARLGLTQDQLIPQLANIRHHNLTDGVKNIDVLVLRFSTQCVVCVV